MPIQEQKVSSNTKIFALSRLLGWFKFPLLFTLAILVWCCGGSSVLQEKMDNHHCLILCLIKVCLLFCGWISARRITKSSSSSKEVKYSYTVPSNTIIFYFTLLFLLLESTTSKIRLTHRSSRRDLLGFITIVDASQFEEPATSYSSLNPDLESNSVINGKAKTDAVLCFYIQCKSFIKIENMATYYYYFISYN